MKPQGFRVCKDFCYYQVYADLCLLLLFLLNSFKARTEMFKMTLIKECLFLNIVSDSVNFSICYSLKLLDI